MVVGRLAATHHRVKIKVTNFCKFPKRGRSRSFVRTHRDQRECSTASATILQGANGKGKLGRVVTSSTLSTTK